MQNRTHQWERYRVPQNVFLVNDNVFDCFLTVFFIITCVFLCRMLLMCLLRFLVRDSIQGLAYTLSALYAIACPSVCLSHGSISQKRLKIGLCCLHHTIAPSLQFLRGKFHPEILTGYSRAGASKKGGEGKISHFLALSVNISKTVADRAKLVLRLI